MSKAARCWIGLMLGTVLTAQQGARAALPGFGRAVAIRDGSSAGPPRVAIRLQPLVDEAADVLFAENRPFQSASLSGSASIDELNRRFGVRAVRPLLSSHLILGQREGGPSVLARRRAAWRQLLARAVGRLPPARAAHPDLDSFPDLVPVYVFELAPGSDPADACLAYGADPHVAYCAPDLQAALYAVPDDPYYHSSGSWGQPYDDLWGLKADKLDAAAAWDLSQGDGVVVAVLDTGLDPTHPDLADNLWVNAAEVPANGIDDDANGYVDDVAGWDFHYGDTDPVDDHGHGTHVSGTIAAVSDNALGIAGVAPHSKIMPLKGFPPVGGGSGTGLAEGIVYAALNGASVINNSWGCISRCPEPFPPIADAILLAHELGTVVVFAAGNESDDVRYYSPQNMPEVVTVAASDPDDQPTIFTNLGFHVDVAAPGGGGHALPPPPVVDRNILSLKSAVTHPNMDQGGALVVGGSFLRQAGTSMASPHGAGLAALIRSRHPEFTADQVALAMRAGADDLGEPGFDLVYGAGRIDAARAVAIDEVPRVEITAPALYTSLHDPELTTMAIEGSAAGDGFHRYELAFRAAGATGWRPIGGPVTTPVERGELGTWDIASLPNGPYILRLAVTTTAGLRFEELTYFVIERLRRLTSDPAAQVWPAFSGNRVAFQDFRHGDAEIYLLDLATAQEQRLTAHSACQAAPAMDGDLVAWQDFRDDPPAPPLCIAGDPHGYSHGCHASPSQIWAVDLKQGLPRQLTGAAAVVGSHPVVSGRRVVWSDWRHGHQEVYAYDLDLGLEQRVTTGASHKSCPHIDGDLVVWVDDRNGSDDIYLLDLATGDEQRLTTAPAARTEPRVAGDLVVWLESQGPGGGLDVVRHDLASGEASLLPPPPDLLHASDGPALSAEASAWAGRSQENLSPEVVLARTGSARPVRVTFAGSNKGGASVSGRRVVWEDLRVGSSGGWDLYLYDPDWIGPMFSDGFESGSTEAWSAAVP